MNSSMLMTDQRFSSSLSGIWALASKDLAPLFMEPELVGTPSAWWTHVPFALWLMTACRPGLFVELGTHYGVSYSAFCKANEMMGGVARCFAVDTWQGDEHAGGYDDSVYEGFKAFHDRHFSHFSTMLRRTFDEALGNFDDGSIDLLHIDGRHRYEDVKHDFESWLPKLSTRAVVIFHDTNVFMRDFGVAPYFAELKAKYSTFEVFHGAGLGIALVGSDAPQTLRELCAEEDPRLVGALRQRLRHLGERWLAETREKLNAAAYADQLAAIQRSTEKLEQVPERLAEFACTIDQLEIENRHLKSLARAHVLARRSDAFRDLRANLKFSLRKAALKLVGAAGRKSLDRMKDADLVRRSNFFDRRWYLAAYPQVAASGMDPARHYALYGFREGCEPSPRFSGRQYLLNNPEVAEEGANPLVHYILCGESEGRSFFPKIAKPLPLVANLAPADRFSILFVSGEPKTPGHAYRVERYMAAAKSNGCDAFWVEAADLTKLNRNFYDVVIIWRTLWSSEIEQLVTRMREFGAKIVFDVDDLMIVPELAKSELIDGIRTQSLTEDQVKGHYESVRQSMLAADVCFATTQELAFHMRRAGKATHVLPNGFDQSIHDFSRVAAIQWRSQKDGLIRIGYAGGSKTHQRDFALAVGALAEVLRARPNCRLVLFETPDKTTSLVDVAEFPALKPVLDQIEWRPLQPLSELAKEMARFDINLAPLEFGNPFCEAKSELKFFEAALVDTPTVASPTGPFLRAIEHGVDGYLAASADDWREYLMRLVDDADLRKKIGRAAYIKALAKFGPRQRHLQFGRVIDQLNGGARAARGFALEAAQTRPKISPPKVYPSNVIFESNKGGWSEVGVVIPLYNYETVVVEALDSVARQTLTNLDLVIVDGCSTDNSLNVAKTWAERHADRFNRIIVLQNQANYGLGLCRNSGYDAAETAYILPLDADNRLLPECCERLLESIKASSAAYVYPIIQHFGASRALITDLPYDPQRFVHGNYIDAMALVAKEAWAMVGGYEHIRHGWEDYDFWCRIAELGLAGELCNEILAEYRVHDASMMYQQTMVPENYLRLIASFEKRHAWVSLIDRETRRVKATPNAAYRPKASRLDDLLPILRCPLSGQKLTYSDDKLGLVTLDGLRRWPIVEGRPVFTPDNMSPEIRPMDLISNDLPEPARAIIAETKGFVLNLSAGGSDQKFDHVVEAEYAIFRHTDLVADAHFLPFDDESFEAVLSMNAFEHYREPQMVAAELLRVLKPGGRIHVRTAFLQPLHEKPWHFYNCTRYGMAEWFKSFDTEKLDVSSNFCPNHTISWLASECETVLRADLAAEAADRFAATPMRDFVEIWRNPAQRQSRIWTDFEALSQDRQEIIAAGFEFIGRKPDRKSEGSKHLSAIVR
ncbi:class I SAM-dependent methyltransferase [Rhodoblastus sp.]|uniref:class I SAM-dependent methyltransferase n=1 Tax=Rhodoblastus sp. TaxID=1962975 RepID=UPI0035B4C2E6